MTAKHILVTGAAGFIGSHLVEALVQAGYNVRALVLPGDLGNLALLPSAVRDALELHFADLRDAAAVRASMVGIEGVFHLGAIISAPYSYRHPAEAIDVNMHGTLNVLRAARAVDVARMVFVSTCAVYGAPQYSPIDEQHPTGPRSPYAAAKLGAEGLATSYYYGEGFPVAIVRPFNTYGPRQSAQAVLPTIIAQALRRPLVELGALSPRRDLMFVGDMVAGLRCAFDADAEALGRPINLGTGTSIAIGDLARRVIDMVGRPVELRTTAERMRAGGDVREWLADTRRARALLGWEAVVGLDEGLRRTIEWMRAHPERFA